MLRVGMDEFEFTTAALTAVPPAAAIFGRFPGDVVNGDDAYVLDAQLGDVIVEDDGAADEDVEGVDVRVVIALGTVIVGVAGEEL